MTSIEGRTVGVTFYSASQDDFKKIAKLREVFEEHGIPSMWTTHTWNGKPVTALDVYENANVVAGYLKYAQDV